MCHKCHLDQVVPDLSYASQSESGCYSFSLGEDVKFLVLLVGGFPQQPKYSYPTTYHKYYNNRVHYNRYTNTYTN